MERDLDPRLLLLALGEHVDLPSAEEVAQLLAEAEIALLLHNPQVSDRLVALGWYLHGIGSSKYALRTYGVERQRAAFQVSAHIFDLLLQTRELTRHEKLTYCFASQLAYLRSTLDPNAIALFRREFAENLDELGLVSSFDEVALSCGVALLGFDVGLVFRLTLALRDEINHLTREWDIDNIFSTPFGAAAGVALGTRDLMSFLAYGRSDLLDRARTTLRTSVRSPNSTEDHFSRWVAAHLLNLADDLNRSSIWTALPPEVPPAVRTAFAWGRPNILTLWLPQLDMFNAGDQENSNPLSSQVKRLFLSTPTSSGKTLLAQLMVMSHLARSTTSVCYVAPTRSLCSEIRRSLESRLRFLGKEVTSGLPEGDWLDPQLAVLDPDVEVMTPERLSYLLQADSRQVLERFGMFIFDEVHLLGDARRGWTLEKDLTYLHHATQNTHHRIVLMSAAVGNQNNFIEWMTLGPDKPFHRQSAWRGPRRLLAIWRTVLERDPSRSQHTGSSQYSPGRGCRLSAKLDVRISSTGEFRAIPIPGPEGLLVFKRGPDGNPVRDSRKSTAYYRMLVPTVHLLAESGPVLVIEATRPATVSMAKAIALELRPVDSPAIRALLTMVESRLGPGHALREVLSKGVAYHHGALPDEIRTSIEEAVSDGHVRVLVATTTLTEGVNLPVRSVVVASQGSYASKGWIEYITGSKLINAIGRAGRAARETEGVVVLARLAAPARDDFRRLEPDNSETHVSSVLASENALKALADFEDLQRSSQDAVFHTATGEVCEFLTFVWFVAAELEKLGEAVTLDGVQEVLGHSLAWVQLTANDRARWLAAAGATIARYAETSATARRRWARAGVAMSSAAEMETIARELTAILQGQEVPQDAAIAVALILGGGRLRRILQLPEAPTRRAYTARGRYRSEITVPMDLMLIDWLGGHDLVMLADTYFGAASNQDFRMEQLGDFVNEYFEVFFPRVLATIVGFTNELLEEGGRAKLLPKSIPANVRWGVSSNTALELLLRGMPSRSLALRIARVWESEEREGSILPWLRSLDIGEWQRTFRASAAELRSILEISRDRRGSVAAQVFAQGMAELLVDCAVRELPPTTASLMPEGGSDLSTINIFVGQQIVGQIPCRDQADVRDLLKSGLTLSIEVSASHGHGVLKLKLEEPDM